MSDETQDKKIHSGDLSVGLIQGMDRLSPSLIKAIDGILWLIAILVALIFIYLVGQILFFMLDVSNSKSIQGIEEFNKVLITVGSLVGALITLGFLVWRTMIAQKQNAIAQENIHSTTMAKAIEQLGAMKEEKITQGRAGVENAAPQETVTNSKPNIEVRLGAIYLLEKLAREHEQLHWPIMEILCAYVRENAGPPMYPTPDVINAYAAKKRQLSEEQEDLTLERERVLGVPRVDIQAAITVIGRRSARQLTWENSLAALSKRSYHLDLSNCNLNFSNFSNLEFSRGNFENSSLEGVNFFKTNLEEASLFNVHIEGGNLQFACLDGAYLRFAHLEGAKLLKSNLIGAILHSAHLEGADLFGAYLISANLSAAHLKNTFLMDTHFEGANAFAANFEAAYFLGSHLEGADLREAHLEGVSFRDAHLDDIWIDGANILDAKDFSQDMADKAWGNAKTVLPPDIDRPVNERWDQDESDETGERWNRWFARHEYWLNLAKSSVREDKAD